MIQFATEGGYCSILRDGFFVVSRSLDRIPGEYWQISYGLFVFLQRVDTPKDVLRHGKVDRCIDVVFSNSKTHPCVEQNKFKQSIRYYRYQYYPLCNFLISISLRSMWFNGVEEKLSTCQKILHIDRFIHVFLV